MKKTFIILMILSLVLLGFVSNKDQQTIIVYSSAEQFRNEELQKQLNEKFPELSVRVMYTPTAKAAAKIFVEKENTDADIILALETSYMNKIKDALAPIDGLSRIDYVDEFKPEVVDNQYVIWERQAGSFIINEDVLKKHNLPTPTSYEELLDPMYKDLIAMPDPNSSGTGYFFYKNLVNTMGEEEALAYFDKLSLNVKQFSESGSGPIKLLKQGEVGIGLALTFQAMNEINKGMPLSIVFPEEGSPYSMTGTGIVKGRETNEDVMRVFDFIINDFIKYDKEHFSPEQIMNNQINSIKDYPTGFKYADMQGIDSIKEKERLLKLWKY
ncbi:MAG: extracellular solute-binding protein [Erysipelothrix sp.]